MAALKHKEGVSPADPQHLAQPLEQSASWMLVGERAGGGVTGRQCHFVIGMCIVTAAAETSSQKALAGVGGPL